MRAILAQTVFFLCVLPMAFFSYDAHFEGHPLTTQYYYIWIKFWMFLATVLITSYQKERMKMIGACISFMLFLRLVWQIWELENYFAANKPYVLDILYLIVMVCILFITFISDSNRFYSYIKTKFSWLS